MSDEQNNPESKPSIRAELPNELLRMLVELLGHKARESTHSVYANTITLGATDVDFKIVFGEGQPTNWHTAVTMPWTVVKLLSFYLQSNLTVHEITNGRVKLPAGLLPPTLVAPPDMETDPTSKRTFEALQAMRQKFMDEQMQLHKQSG
jgi:hypothetical protein